MFIIGVSLKANFFSRNIYESTLVHSYISFRTYTKYFYVLFKAGVENTSMMKVGFRGTARETESWDYT